MMEKINRVELEQCYDDCIKFTKQAERLQILMKKDNKTDDENHEVSLLSKELKNNLGDQIILQVRVVNFINQIEDPDMKKMIALHYLGMKSWEEVAAMCKKETDVQDEVEKFLESAF